MHGPREAHRGLGVHRFQMQPRLRHERDDSGLLVRVAAGVDEQVEMPATSARRTRAAAVWPGRWGWRLGAGEDGDAFEGLAHVRRAPI
jgi:hypothetical protein